MIAIIDYGMGNLRSVQKAFEYLGFEAIITNDKTLIRNADKIVLPGVGAFAKAVKTIKESNMDKEIEQAIDKGKPFLGICLGMQLLFEQSYEYGQHKGLGILKGEIKRLPDTVKIPHVGWNSLNIKMNKPLFKGLDKESYVYFVHSYYLETSESIVSATTTYGKEIAIAVQHKNVFGVQFHPEKSGDIGLKILGNFGRF